MSQIDPITLEVMRNAFQSVAEEMGAALIRTALSPNIKDRRDCSTAIYTGAGELVSQAEHIPLHLGLMVSVVKKTLEKFPIERLEPGDAVITNDPYISGSHLPDIVMITPVFIEGKCIALLANLAHHVDIGGIVPGGMPTISTEIFQEGLRIPPVKFCRRGEINEEIMGIITNNVRTSYETQGDFQAQLAANNVGERRIREIISKYGPDMVSFYMNGIMDYAERRMVTSIEKLPKGTFSFEDCLEGDGLTDNLLKIRATLTIENDRLLVDFTGTDSQAKGSVNCTRAVTLACVYYALKSAIDPELPSSAGTFRPVEVKTPLGTLVNPKFPAPVSNANINTSQRITEVILGALSKTICERVPAASTGSMSIFTIGGVDPRNGEYYSYVETYGGGQGGLLNQDGMDGVHVHMTNTMNTPTEVIEIAYPLRVERYGLVPDSDGPGRFRGGLGLTREITIIDHHATIAIGTERRKIRPWGLMGGKPGRGSDSWLVSPEGEKKPLPSKVTRQVEPGTRIVLRTAGGGGFGDPFERTHQDVSRDIEEGLVNPTRARDEYGVVINQGTGEVDKEATDLLREQGRSE
ncbi:MAG: hydantoinase B/oxoprolinase family protein [Desulfobacteraceae bacterium]|nr:MAG: hydantoinase B/oxoprolinase family protein [Desulfobacteraceae bacterium]